VEKKTGTSYLWFGLFGAFFCATIVSWLGPNIIAWYYDPGSKVVFSCGPAVKEALSRLRWVQLGALVVGLLGGLFVRFAFRRTQPASVEAGPTRLS
jgi:hypothetical protein